MDRSKHKVYLQRNLLLARVQAVYGTVTDTLATIYSKLSSTFYFLLYFGLCLNMHAEAHALI